MRHSLIEAEEALQCHELFLRAVLEMHATPVHRVFPSEQLQVRSDEDAVLLQGAGADLFAVGRVGNYTIDVLVLEHAS